VDVDAQVDCAQPLFAAALNSSRLAKPRTIVDLVPFGYDIDKLEVRLIETYDLVDVFIVYESPVTLVGARKPYYFNMVRHSPRFKKFEVTPVIKKYLITAQRESHSAHQASSHSHPCIRARTLKL
jgi:hypothetical protein